MSSKEPFKLFSRKESGVFYVQFLNEQTKKYITAKSTGAKQIDSARKIAWQWYYTGEIPGRVNGKQTTTVALENKQLIQTIAGTDFTDSDIQKIITIFKQKSFIVSAVTKNSLGNRSLTDFLTEFYDYDKSPYVLERRSRGHSIHRKYCYNYSGLVRNYFLPIYGTKVVGEFTKHDMKNFMNQLIKEGKSPDIVNSATKAISVAMKWAYNNELTEHDCFTGLTFCTPNRTKREILTMEQATAVFRADWKDESARLANLIAMTTGMRAGEILALRLCDIGVDRIYVKHSWNRFDGLKECKNGESREVPLLMDIRDQILEQAKQNPYEEGMDGFIFFGTIPGKPIDTNSWLKNLRCVLTDLGVKNAKEITFHGWRHLYATRMASVVEQRKLQQATGHKTLAMLEHYQDHETMEDFRDLTNGVHTIFGPMIGDELNLRIVGGEDD